MFVKKVELNYINKLVKLAIDEDKINQDITSKLTIPSNFITNVKIISKDYGILYGIELVKKIIKVIDKTIIIKVYKSDGHLIKPNIKIVELKGKARSILKIERIILIF